MLVDNPIITRHLRTPRAIGLTKRGSRCRKTDAVPWATISNRAPEDHRWPCSRKSSSRLDCQNILVCMVRPCVGTPKSHISHVVLDVPRGEHSVAYQLEQIPLVIAYARNEHLDFTIPYEWECVRHEDRPDYIVRLRGEDGLLEK